MSAIPFWTPKRLEAVSKTSLTLFQAFLVAGFLGGTFGKIATLWAKGCFMALTLALFIIGMLFSDWPLKKER